MAGERSVAGVLAGAGSGAGAPGLLGLLLAMEAGIPIPVPSDLVMLLLGERVSAGALPLWLAAPALVLGSSLFLQAHLVLGYALGPAARELLEQARLPVLAAAAIVLAATATLLLRRRRPRVTRVLAEGACPACLALGLVRGGGT
jgi:membrane protein DedA with SNARE-associated domain